MIPILGLVFFQRFPKLQMALQFLWTYQPFYKQDTAIDSNA